VFSRPLCQTKDPGLLRPRKLGPSLWPGPPDLPRAERSRGWLLTRLGAEPFQSWEHARSWRHGDVYVVVEQSPALVGHAHERRFPGLNHLAFHAPGDLDALVAEARDRGWRLLFPDRHPFAGGPEHRAAYLEDADGYEVELVASVQTGAPMT
jgi:catechol 2,3-dioxygenase-like lactoylglutathione lyase family enzyme